jgi:hypothetical protein
MRRIAALHAVIEEIPDTDTPIYSYLSVYKSHLQFNIPILSFPMGFETIGLLYEQYQTNRGLMRMLLS